MHFRKSFPRPNAGFIRSILGTILSYLSLGLVIAVGYFGYTAYTFKEPVMPYTEELQELRAEELSDISKVTTSHVKIAGIGLHPVAYYTYEDDGRADHLIEDYTYLMVPNTAEYQEAIVSAENSEEEITFADILPEKTPVIVVVNTDRYNDMHVSETPYDLPEESIEGLLTGPLTTDQVEGYGHYAEQAAQIGDPEVVFYGLEEGSEAPLLDSKSKVYMLLAAAVLGLIVSSILGAIFSDD